VTKHVFPESLVWTEGSPDLVQDVLKLEFMAAKSSECFGNCTAVTVTINQ